MIACASPTVAPSNATPLSAWSPCPFLGMCGTSKPLCAALRRICDITLMDCPRESRKDKGTPVTRAISM